jgi:2-polyprenyl-3-methyl-5-hydroxy-6-metoxy-1,4-benzoquinol methylase
MTDDPVREQYERLPYPPRDPDDEARRLITGSPSHILEVDHYVFAGRRDFDRPFRVLVAGGGTGDATIMLAQQLSDVGADARIVHLDISEASIATARARARARGLDAIEFVHGSLTDLAGRGYEPFDYIDCCGVLHHLEDPLAGLRALTASLAPDGGMGVMLYAPFGRTGVYQAQAMLRMLGADAPADVRLDLARRLLDGLPATNWLKRNPFVGDHATLGDAGIFDLLLHERDRAFTVFDVAELLSRSGLRLVTFIDPLRYDPMIYLGDEQLAARLRAMPLLQRCAFAELLCGNMKTHVFYAVHSANGSSTVAIPDTPAIVPMLRDLDGEAVAREIAAGGALKVDLDGIKTTFPLPPMASAIFARIDGVRSMGEIQRDISETEAPGIDWLAFANQFQQVYRIANGLSRVFLRAPGVSRARPR